MFAITNSLAISAGSSHSIALLDDHTVKAWGLGSSGQTGQNATTNNPTPVLVLDSAGGYLTNVQAVSAGALHNIALMTDTTLRAWGEDGHGELGDGPGGSDKLKAVKVLNLTNVTAISAGGGHNLAISNGFVYGWGELCVGAFVTC